MDGSAGGVRTTTVVGVGTGVSVGMGVAVGTIAASAVSTACVYMALISGVGMMGVEGAHPVNRMRSRLRLRKKRDFIFYSNA